MTEARLGRWNTSDFRWSIRLYLLVEMTEARLGRWNLQLSCSSFAGARVEMTEARLGDYADIRIIIQRNLYSSLMISDGNSFPGRFVKIVSDSVSDILMRTILIGRLYILFHEDEYSQTLYPSIFFRIFLHKGSRFLCLSSCKCNGGVNIKSIWILFFGCFGHYGDSSQPRRQDVWMTGTRTYPD